jgi:hypothetical protein
MQYPVLNSNSKAINLASTASYSCMYDIVWSFDYAISGNSNTEAGFTVFLMADGNGLTGGNTGIDLGYSGLSSTNLPYSIKAGVSGAILAVGFDTTGLFAASAFSGSYVRDGVSPTNINKNSVVMRGGAPYYRYSDYNYNVPLSSLNSSFSIVESGAIFKTIRARLGKVGNTLYIDYRNNPTEDFKPIFQKDITLGIPVSSYVYVGISFATPISSSSLQSIGNIYLKNFSVEGSINPNMSSTTISNQQTILPLNETSVYPGITSIPEVNEDKEPGVEVYPPITDIFPVRSSGEDNMGVNINLLGGSVAGINIIQVPTCSNIATLPDLYNFGYKLKIIQTDTILTRTNYFTYTGSLSTNTIQLVDYNSGWTLTYNGSAFTNPNQTPNGLYTGIQNLSVIYIDE